MSALEEEVIEMLRNKFLITGLDDQLCTWSPRKLLEIYHILLSVHSSSYDQEYEDEETSLKHTCRCMRQLELGHLVAKPSTLVDFRKAPRIITALADKISARYGSNTGQRIRSVIKSLQKKKRSLKSKSCKQVEGFKHQENVEPSAALSEPSLGRSSEAGTVFTGRQIPRTPLRTLNAHNRNSDSRLSVALSPEKNTRQLETVTKNQPVELRSGESIEGENILGKVDNIREVDEQVSILPAESRSLNKIPSGKQLGRTPDHYTMTNFHEDQHRVTATPLKTELHQTLVTSQSSYCTGVHIPQSCSDSSKEVSCDKSHFERPVINEKYHGLPLYVSPPEEFCSDSMPQCVFNGQYERNNIDNGQNERNNVEDFSVLKSYPSDGVPPNMITSNLQGIENLTFTYDWNENSSEISCHTEDDKFKKFVRDGSQKEIEIVPQDKVIPHEAIPVLLANSSFQNASGSTCWSQTLPSSLANSIPSGRQLIRTPPLVIPEQILETGLSCSTTSEKPKSFKTLDTVSDSSDISYDATSKESFGNNFVVATEKEGCRPLHDLHDSSVVDSRGQDEEDIINIDLQEIAKSTPNVDDKDDSLQIFRRGKQRKLAELKEPQYKGHESNITVSKILMGENRGEQISKRDNTKRNSLFSKEKRYSLLEELPVLSASFSFHYGRESSSQSLKHLSVLENSIPTGRQLSRTPPLNMAAKDSDLLADSENIAEIPNTTSEGCSSLSSAVSEKTAELKTDTGVKIETDGSHVKQGITNVSIQIDICQSMLDVGENESLEIFPKEKKVRKIKEKPQNVGGTIETEVPKDIDDIPKENLQNVGSVAEAAAPENPHNASEEILQHLDGAVVSKEIFLERKTLQSKNRNSLRRIAVQKSTFIKEKGNIRKVWVEDDSETDWKSCHQSINSSGRNASLEERSSHILIECAQEGKQVCVRDSSLLKGYSETNVKETRQTRKTWKQNAKTQEEELHCMLSRDIQDGDEVCLVDEDESFEIFPKRRPVQSETRSSHSKNASQKTTAFYKGQGENQVCVEDYKKSGHQVRGTLRQKPIMQDKKSHNVLINSIQEDNEDCVSKYSFVEVCPEMGVRKSKQTRSLRKNARPHKEEFHHMLAKDIQDCNKDVCGTGENESLEVFVERRSTCSSNVNSPSKTVIKKTPSSNKGISKNQVCVESDPGTDEKPRRRTSRQNTKDQEEKSHLVLTEDAQEDVKVGISGDSPVKVCSETTVKKVRHQTKKTQHRDTKVKWKESHPVLTKGVVEGNDDSISLCGIKSNDKCFTEVNKEISEEGNLDISCISRKPRDRKKNNKADAVIDSSGENVSLEDKNPNEILKPTLRRTRYGSRNPVAPVISENYQSFGSRRNVHKSRGITEGKNLEANDNDTVEGGCTDGDTSKVIFGNKKEQPSSEAVSSIESIKHDICQVDAHRQTRKRGAKTAGVNLEVPVVKTRAAKKRCPKKIDSNIKRGEEEYSCIEEDIKAAAADGIRTVTLGNVKKRSDPNRKKKEQPSSEASYASESIKYEISQVDVQRQIRKRRAKIDRTSLEVAVVRTRGAKKRCSEKTDSNIKEGEKEYTHSQEDLKSAAADGKRIDTLRNAKKSEDIAVSSSPSKTMNILSDDSDASENKVRKKTFRGRVTVKSSGKKSTRRTAGSRLRDVLETNEIKSAGSRLKDVIETSEIKNLSGVKRTKSKKGREKF